MIKTATVRIDPTISIVIVNYNSGCRLARCLDRLERQSFRAFEILIMDNASTDGSLKFAPHNSHPIRIIKLDHNIGFAAANNAAAREAKGEWIALLNPDAYPEPDWLQQLASATARFPGVDAFGSLQLEAGRPDHMDGAGDVCTIYGVTYRGGVGRAKAALPPEAECFAPCAAAALYRRETFLRLGGFDEDFFCYGEDVDLGFRLRNEGGRAVQVNCAVVLHEGSGVSGRRSAFTIYHGHRNRIWLFYKNMPRGLYFATTPLRAAADIALLLKCAVHGRAGVYMRALIDGYSGLSGFREKRNAVAAMRRKSGADIAKALCWSPIKTLRRSIDLRPLESQAGAGGHISQTTG